MPILDTQRVTDELVASGMPQPQARAVTAKLEEAAQAARGNLVTVEHLEGSETRTKSALEGVEIRFKSALEGVEIRFNSALEQFKAEVNTRFAETDARNADRMRTQFVALVAAMIDVAGATLAVARLLG